MLLVIHIYYQHWHLGYGHLWDIVSLQYAIQPFALWYNPLFYIFILLLRCLCGFEDLIKNLYLLWCFYSGVFHCDWYILIWSNLQERLLEAGIKRSISVSSTSFWPSFILGDTLRIVFQNLLLESNDEILECTERVWKLLLQVLLGSSTFIFE